MAVRGSALHKKHNPPHNHLFFIMVACSGHILESTKEIKTKLDTYIDVHERKYRTQETLSYLTFYLSYLSLILFIKGVFLCHVLV